MLGGGDRHADLLRGADQPRHVPDHAFVLVNGGQHFFLHVDHEQDGTMGIDQHRWLPFLMFIGVAPEVRS